MRPSSRTGSHARVISPDRSGIRQWSWIVLLSLLMLAASLASSAVLDTAAGAQDATGVAGESPDAADVADVVNPSVVTVYTYSPSFAPGSNGLAPTGAGSGWAYTNDGYVITNAHVVLGVDDVKVMTYHGDLIPATVVGTDWYQDIAVLKLEPDDGQSLPPAAMVGDSSDVRAGDQVIAIGTPLGQFANTVTVGNVGAVDRSLNTNSGYTLGNLIQHDASLSPGNSGGPLFSMGGEVVGMNVAKVDTLNTGEPAVGDISFAIEANSVVTIADEIIANGGATYPYLGIESQAERNGQVVVNVEDESPAGQADIQPGDVIIAIDDQAVNVDSWFVDQLYQYNPEDTVTLTIERDGATITIQVTLGARPVSD